MGIYNLFITCTALFSIPLHFGLRQDRYSDPPLQYTAQQQLSLLYMAQDSNTSSITGINIMYTACHDPASNTSTAWMMENAFYS